MRPSPYSYTIARYVEDPIRNEPRNIGVILQCPEMNFISARFTSSYRASLSNAASQLDISILKAYAEDFTLKFQPFRTPSTQISLSSSEFLKDGYIAKLSRTKLGKLQFTQPRGGVTTSPVVELEYLFETFVEKIAPGSREVMKSSRLKTELKQEFKKMQVLDDPKELKKGKPPRGFQIDTEVGGARSQQKHRVDFGHQDGQLVVVEAVDMRRTQREIELKTFESALKIDDLRDGWEGQKKEFHGYSVVALPEGTNGSMEYFLAILRTYSDLVIFSDQKKREKFQKQILDLIGSNPILF